MALIRSVLLVTIGTVVCQLGIAAIVSNAGDFGNAGYLSNAQLVGNTGGFNSLSLPVPQPVPVSSPTGRRASPIIERAIDDDPVVGGFGGIFSLLIGLLILLAIIPGLFVRRRRVQPPVIVMVPPTPAVPVTTATTAATTATTATTSATTTTTSTATTAATTATIATTSATTTTNIW